MPIQKISDKVVYPELSYQLTGLLFEVHNTLGRFAKEKQYGDAFESLLKEHTIVYQREKNLPFPNIENKFTNIVDFAINNQIIVDLKAKPFVMKEDYHQMPRYLEASNFKLGIIVNFRNKYLKPVRII